MMPPKSPQGRVAVRREVARRASRQFCGNHRQVSETVATVERRAVAPRPNVVGTFMATPDAPPAGWYEDPRDKSRLRYWDGAAWDDSQDAGAQGQASDQRAGDDLPPPALSRGTKMDEPFDWSDRSNWGAIALLAIAAIFLLSRCGGDEPAEPASAPPASEQPAPPAAAEEERPERIRVERVDAPTSVVSFSAASAEVLEVLFTVRNPEAVVMETVACSVNAYVSTQQVARLLSSGVAIRDLQPGEIRRVTTSARIRNDQAASVTRAEVVCSSRLPENRPAAVDVAPGDAAGDGAEDDAPALSVEDVRQVVMTLVFASSRTDIIRIVTDLFSVESVDLYDYDPETGTVTLEATPTSRLEDRHRDAAWELYRLFGMGLYGGDGDAWLVEDPPFAPNLRITLASVRYECDGPTMRRIPVARLSRAQFEEECRVR